MLLMTRKSTFAPSMLGDLDHTPPSDELTTSSWRVSGRPRTRERGR